MAAREGPARVAGARATALRGHATARLSADVLGAVTGLAAGVITARALGPAGKGVLSTLLLVISVGSHAATLGLGEAAIVRLGQRRESTSDLARALLMAAILPACLMGAALGVAVHLILRQQNPYLVAAAATAVPVLAAVQFLSMVLNAERRLVLTSAVLAVGFAVNAVGTVVLVLVLGLGIFGAVLAQLVASTTALMLVLVALRRLSLSVRPRWRPRTVVEVLRIGLPLEGSRLLVALASRLDQLVVLSLAGKAAAGTYSVALTLAQLATYAPFALAVAAFPNFAQLPSASFPQAVVRVVRSGVAAATVTGLLLALALPFLVPLLFGEDFRRAVRPALLLLVASLVGSGQWLICQALAARGQPRSLLRSYALSLGVMLILDLVLVPFYGVVGAAVASVAAAVAGCAYAVHVLRPELGDAQRWVLLPRPGDVRELFSLFARLLRSPRSRTGSA